MNDCCEEETYLPTLRPKCDLEIKFIPCGEFAGMWVYDPDLKESNGIDGHVGSTVKSNVMLGGWVRDWDFIKPEMWGDGINALRAADKESKRSCKEIYLQGGKVYELDGPYHQSDNVSITSNPACKATLKFSGDIDIAVLQETTKEISLRNVKIDTTAVEQTHAMLVLSGVWHECISNICLINDMVTDPFDQDTPTSYGIILRNLYKNPITPHPVIAPISSELNSSTRTNFGTYYNHIDCFDIDGCSVGILEVSSEDGGSSRVNQNLYSAGSISNCYHGTWRQEVGGGSTEINVSQERAIEGGVTTVDQKAGTSPIKIGGEVTGNVYDVKGINHMFSITNVVDGVADANGLLPTHLRVTPAQARVRGRIYDNV